jgi:hypothetical protein
LSAATLKGSTVPHRSFPRFCAIGALLGVSALASMLAAGPASASECTWGERGYRACVDGKLGSRRESARRGERQVYKTAPARRRPGTLTPVDPAPFELSSPPRGPTHAPSQENRLDAISRENMRRDAIPNPIMPPNSNANTIPGRICPPLGC